jgi:hypothetical protein
VKNYYAWGFLEVPTDFLNHFWLLDPDDRFATETAVRTAVQK